MTGQRTDGAFTDRRRVHARMAGGIHALGLRDRLAVVARLPHARGGERAGGEIQHKRIAIDRNRDAHRIRSQPPLGAAVRAHHGRRVAEAEPGQAREGDALGVVSEHEEVEAVGDRGGAASGPAGAFDGAFDGEHRGCLSGPAPAVDQHCAGALADHPGPCPPVDPPVAERVEQRRHVIESLQSDAPEIRGEEPFGRGACVLLVAPRRGQHRAHVSVELLDRHGANRMSSSIHRIVLVPWHCTIIGVRRPRSIMHRCCSSVEEHLPVTGHGAEMLTSAPGVLHALG